MTNLTFGHDRSTGRQPLAFFAFPPLGSSWEQNRIHLSTGDRGVSRRGTMHFLRECTSCSLSMWLSRSRVMVTGNAFPLLSI